MLVSQVTLASFLNIRPPRAGRRLPAAVPAYSYWARSSGVPVPGETALITSSVLASQGHLSIELVIIVAAAAAIIGDNIGYLIKALSRALAAHAPRALSAAASRSCALVRAEPEDPPSPRPCSSGASSPACGSRRRGWPGMTMRWPTFLLWNALGGICWATAIGLLAYFLGNSTTIVRHPTASSAAVVAIASANGAPHRAEAQRAAHPTRTRPHLRARTPASGTSLSAVSAVAQQPGESAPLHGATRWHMSASRLSSTSEKREEKETRAPLGWCVTRASATRSRPAPVRQAKEPRASWSHEQRSSRLSRSRRSTSRVRPLRESCACSARSHMRIRPPLESSRRSRTS